MNWITIISFFITILIQTLAWGIWAGTTNAKLDALTKAVEKLQERDDLYYKKDEAAAQVKKRDEEIASLWKFLNTLNDKFNECRAARMNCK